MEYALRLADPESAFGGPQDLQDAALRRLCPDGPVKALYFGSEFCQELLPPVRSAEAFCKLGLRRGLDVVLLTPPLTHTGLKRLERLLRALTSHGWFPGVVCNDWGALELLREEYPTLPRRLGRLMNRGLRDPRLEMAGAATGSEHVERGAGIRKLALTLGITALESDADLEPGYLGDGAERLERTLHLPYTFVATGRNCLEKAAATPAGRYVFTRDLGSRCSRPCRDICRSERRPDCDRRLWRSGNTLFSATTPERAARHLALADRVVLHERALP